MQYQLTMSGNVFEQLQREHSGRLPQVTRFQTGLSRIPSQVEWLAGDTLPQNNDNTSAPCLIVVCGEHSEFLEAEFERQKARLSDNNLTVLLALGTGTSAGKAAAVCQLNRLAGLDVFKVAMPGLPRITFNRPDSPLGPAIFDEWSATESSESDRELSLHHRETWSRTIGVLGEEAFRRIANLHVAVVGCGRSGSQLAASLNRLGIRKLSLIDSDRMEPHNLGEMDAVTAADVGRHKVDAVADHLNRYGPLGRHSDQDLPVHPVPESILSLAGLIAAKQADVLFCCVDDPAARLATAFIATLYLRPLIDVGTGITMPSSAGRQTAFSASSTRQQMGADVRLIVPGDRCLMCLGGVASFEQARKDLLSGTAGAARGDWRTQRAGSLYSLNGVAVQLAMRLFEDFLSTRIQRSTWLRLDMSSQAEPSLRTHTELRSPVDCQFCGVNGRGDAGVEVLAHLLERS